MLVALSVCLSARPSIAYMKKKPLSARLSIFLVRLSAQAPRAYIKGAASVDIAPSERIGARLVVGNALSSSALSAARQARLLSVLTSADREIAPSRCEVAAATQ